MPSAADLAKGFSVLNILNDAWGVERLIPPYIARTTATLTANTASFTVGTGGNINTVRPVFFTGIAFQDISQSPTLEFRMEQWTDDQYRLQPLKALTSTLPAAAYYNPTYASGFGTLIPWPIPTSATLQWVVYSPVTIPQFATTSTTISYPPGYYDFIVKVLTFELCSVYGVPAEVRSNAKTMADEATKKVKYANFRLTDLETRSIGGNNRMDYLGFLTGP